MRAIIIASHLFAPTHHGLARLAAGLAKHVEIALFAKHPAAYPDRDVPVPQPFENPTGPWTPRCDVVHCVGGGETAIRVAKALCTGPALIVSFVGAVDLTRQLDDTRLQTGYQTLFRRAHRFTCPSEDAAIRLAAHGAPRERILVVPQPLTLAEYPARDAGAPRWAIVAARDIPRKKNELAIAVAHRCTRLEQLVAVGFDRPLQNPHICMSGPVPHAALIDQMRHCRVLLQTASWEGPEFDDLPMVVLEALAMRLAVVSTPLRGVLRLNALFPGRIRTASTVDGLAAAVDNALVADEAGSKEAAVWIRRQHGIEAALERVLDLYRGVAK